MAYEKISESPRANTIFILLFSLKAPKHLTLHTLHVVGTGLNFKFGCVMPRSHFLCSLTQFLLRTAPAGEPGNRSSCSISALKGPRNLVFLSQGTFFTIWLVTSHLSGLWEIFWVYIRRDIATGRAWNHNKICVLYLFVHSFGKCLWVPATSRCWGYSKEQKR